MFWVKSFTICIILDPMYFVQTVRGKQARGFSMGKVVEVSGIQLESEAILLVLTSPLRAYIYHFFVEATLLPYLFQQRERAYVKLHFYTWCSAIRSTKFGTTSWVARGKRGEA